MMEEVTRWTTSTGHTGVGKMITGKESVKIAGSFPHDPDRHTE